MAVAPVHEEELGSAQLGLNSSSVEEQGGFLIKSLCVYMYHVVLRKMFLQNLISSRDGPVEVQKQGKDESTPGHYPTLEWMQ